MAAMRVTLEQVVGAVHSSDNFLVYATTGDVLDIALRQVIGLRATMEPVEIDLGNGYVLECRTRADLPAGVVEK